MNYEEHDGYIVIGAIHGGCMYEWYIKAALYHPEHKTYHLYEDSGCSCNYPFETGYWIEGKSMDRPGLIREINRHRTDSVDHDFTVEMYNDLAQAVREFDPKEIN